LLAPRARAQLDPGNDVWAQYVFNFDDKSQTTFATVILVNTTEFSGFTTGTEYWYVNLGSLGLLGSYDLYGYESTYGSSPAPVAPKYSSGMQSFTLAENPGWGSGWTTDPVSGGYLFSSWGSAGVYLRVNLAYSGGSYEVSQITWYQVLSSGSPANISPSGHMPATSGSVSVPSGYTGYDISQAT